MLNIVVVVLSSSGAEETYVISCILSCARCTTERIIFVVVVDVAVVVVVVFVVFIVFVFALSSSGADETGLSFLMLSHVSYHCLRCTTERAIVVVVVDYCCCC